MSDLGGKGFKECVTCVNRKYDPFQCAKCVKASKWEPDGADDDQSDDISGISFQEEIDG